MIYMFLVGLALGAGLFFWRDAYVKRQRRRIPKSWPLALRPLLNNREKRVWAWLSKVMFDHQIAIKLPVTRFTTPLTRGEATHWYTLLNGAYCTFTIYTAEGKVIGCIDVPGPQGLSLGNQSLKHSLLSQCGIRYWVVDPTNLPHLAQIRAAFLGEQAAKAPQASDFEHQFKDVRDHLQAAVHRQRAEKNSGFARLDASIGNTSEYGESRLSSGWEQNSFVAPLDSRASELKP